MTLGRFNYELRRVLGNLISDGFQQKDVSGLTFGLNRQDQLRSFLQGRDISGKPLQRILDGLGFELHIVPVGKKDIEELERLETISENSMEALQLTLVEYLENLEGKRKRKSNIVQYVDMMINKFNSEEN